MDISLATLMFDCSLALTASLSMTATTSPQDASLPSETTTQVAIPPVVPSADRMPSASDVATEIIGLLDTLEASASQLHAFTAKITYIVQETFTESMDTRRGEFIYDHVGGTQGKRFAVLFDEHVVDGRLRKQLKHYIFDGRWLAEIDHEHRQFFKREIVAPGESFDPLKLGEGPIPLPIGQSRDEVLKRFVVTRIELPTEGFLSRLSEAYAVDGLRLTPRDGTPESKEFDRVDLFFDRETHLPVGIEAIEKNARKTKTVRFAALERLEALSDDLKRKLDISEPRGADWRKDVRPWGS